MSIKYLFFSILLFTVAGCQIQRSDVNDDYHPDMVRLTIYGTRTVEVARYPITVQQFSYFMSKSNYLTDAERNSEQGCWGVKEDKSVGWLSNENWRRNRLKQNDQHPVVCVSWNDALAYTEWLSILTGEKYRLPYVEEWEYAANGGLQRKFYYGDDHNKVCKYINHADLNFLSIFNEHAIVSHCDDGYAETSPVGSYHKNKHGLYDMYGNVWEWQLDCDDTDSRNNNCEKYILKGASYASNPDGIVVGYKIVNRKSMRTTDYGFRVIKVEN